MWPFSEKKETKNETRAAASPVPVQAPKGQPKTGGTLLGKDISIKGDLEAAHDVVLLGYHSGKIKGNKVEVGVSAKVVGDITAQDVVFSGNLDGNIDAKGRVHVNANAKVLGGIKASQISVDEKALLGGKFEARGT